MIEWVGRAGGVKMSQEAGSLRTNLPLYVVNLFILEKHLPLKMLFSEAFSALVIYNLPRVSPQKAST